MNQTLREVEIICVDDCSTDGTLLILERLAAQDDRIKIVRHEKNQGLMSVRYHGLQASCGEYITFLDGDDLLDVKTCQESMRIARTNNVDIVQFGTLLFETENVPPEQILSLNQTMAPCMKKMPRKQGALVKCCYEERLFSWNLCCKFIRREVQCIILCTDL